MKKLVALAMVLLLALSFSYGSAEVKFDDGIPLSQKQAILLTVLESMWQSDEWQRVEVPAGVYEVGVEIPEGEWTISNDDMFIVRIGPHLNETKTEIDYQGMKFGNLIDMDDYKNGLTANLIKGDYIYLSDAVVFTTPIKGQGFVFK